MNNIDSVVTVLSSGLSLLGLACLYLWLYRDYRRDLLRTRLFAIRAELFDGAADGRLDFNHPAYGLLRGMLNGFLRSGHEIGAFRLLLTALVIDSDELEALFGFKQKWNSATNSLSPELRKWLELMRSEAHNAFFKHLLVTNGPAYLCVIFWLTFREARRRNRRRHRRSGNHIPSPPASFNFSLDSAALATAGGAYNRLSPVAAPA